MTATRKPLTDDQIRQARKAAENFLSAYAAFTLVGRTQDLYSRLNRWTGRALAFGIPVGNGKAENAEAAARFLMLTDSER